MYLQNTGLFTDLVTDVAFFTEKYSKTIFLTFPDAQSFKLTNLTNFNSPSSYKFVLAFVEFK